MRKTYAAIPNAELSTRHCLDPWFDNLLDADRGLHPCCWHPAVGTLPVGGSLADLLEGPAMREIRHQLLTGQLNQHCQECPSRALTTPDRLRQVLIERLAEAQEM
jgi:hypothetical protein